jgi:hypothetical protein
MSWTWSGPDPVEWWFYLCDSSGAPVSTNGNTASGAGRSANSEDIFDGPAPFSAMVVGQDGSGNNVTEFSNVQFFDAP